MYDHPAGDEIPGVKSMGVGDNFPSRLAKDATEVRNKITGILDALSPLP